SINGAGSVDLARPFVGDGTEEGFSPVMAGAAILCLSFLGFDSVSTLAEETRDPKRALPKAITLVTIVAGVIFVALAYVSHLAYPSHDFVDTDSAALDVMGSVGGEFLTVFFTAAYVAGATGSALASQASASRILFAMGRDQVLPKRVFGGLSARFQTPVTAILIVSTVSLLAVFVELQLISETVSFGALVAFSAVNLSVIKHYFIDQGRRTPGEALRFLVLPGIGLGLTVWLWTSLSATALTIGLIWLAIGLAWLAWITRGFRRAAPMLDLTE
ncbi:APC family permease, partial [Leucobacter sp. M11]|uniref:APC family permease n=1 Tax=Leucobacter sp. M11 TaxID=2993565 RepID=UPI002D805228